MIVHCIVHFFFSKLSNNMFPLDTTIPLKRVLLYHDLSSEGLSPLPQQRVPSSLQLPQPQLSSSLTLEV